MSSYQKQPNLTAIQGGGGREAQNAAGGQADEVAVPATASHMGGMGTPDVERLAKLEGQLDTLKVVRPMMLTVVSVVLAALVLVLGFLATQLQAVSSKIDAIPTRLSEEFRAMRAEMSAQTSAIANSITAARQGQPSIIYSVPAPTEKPLNGVAPSQKP